MFKDEIRAGGLIIRWALIAIVVVIIIGFIGVYGFGWFQTTTAERRGQVGQTERVIADPSYRIPAYNHFYDLCASIQTKSAQIKQAESDLELANGDPDAVRDARTNLTALRNQRIEAINQYNADAHKTDTLANFQASDLPFTINPNEENVQCAA